MQEEMKTEYYVEIFDLLEKEYGEKAPSPGQVKVLWQDPFMVTVQWIKESEAWCLRRL